MEYMSDEDRWYILLSLMRLSEWEVIEIEKSMRWWVIISIWKEACQLEKKARKWKWEDYNEVDPIISYDLPLRDTPQGYPWDLPQINPNQINPNQPKSTQINPNQDKTEFNFIPEWKEETILATLVWYFLQLWWKIPKKENWKTISDWYISTVPEMNEEKEFEMIRNFYNYWNERRLEEDLENKNWKLTFSKTWKYSLPK
jgi:hypothetical protein